MSLRKTEKETGKGGALVLASMPAVAHQSHGCEPAERDASSKAAANCPIVATRSAFLAQLTSQYESKGAACARRMDARAFASKCYSQKSPKPRMRHLVWA